MSQEGGRQGGGKRGNGLHGDLVSAAHLCLPCLLEVSPGHPIRQNLFLGQLTQPPKADRHHTTGKEPASAVLLFTLGFQGEIWEHKLTLEEEEHLLCPEVLMGQSRAVLGMS